MTLEEHILQCELRYQEINHRLDTLEQKVDELKTIVEGFRNTIIDYAIKGFIGLVLLIAGSVFVIQI